MKYDKLYQIKMTKVLPNGRTESIIDIEFYSKDLANDYIKVKSKRPVFKKCKFNIIEKDIGSSIAMD